MNNFLVLVSQVDTVLLYYCKEILFFDLKRIKFVTFGLDVVYKLVPAVLWDLLAKLDEYLDSVLSEDLDVD